MVQLVWKFLFCVVAIIAFSQICECRVSSFPLDDEEIFPDQMTEDDIESAELQNELWDVRESRSFPTRDFEDGKQLLEEEGHRRKRATYTPALVKVNANQLRKKIRDAKRQNRYYYIGYTNNGANSYYLKTTGPKSKEWKNKFIKDKTYYANIGGSGVTERQLVNECKTDLLCVNGATAATKPNPMGIVYVVFGQKRGDEDFYSDADSDIVTPKDEVRSKINRVRDALDKFVNLLRLNRFE